MPRGLSSFSMRRWGAKGEFFPFCAKRFVYIAVDFTPGTIGIKEEKLHECQEERCRTN